MSTSKKNTYKDIFSSSLIVGGAQFITLFFNLIRAKVLAVILGPAGTGIIGIYTSTAMFINTVFGLGTRSSSVRQIAYAAGKSDDKTISKTVTVFRRTVFITSFFAAVFVIFFAKFLSELSFDDSTHTTGMMFLAAAVFFSGISDGQWALLQGLRKIKQLAKSRILGALLGSVSGILFIYFLKDEGILPFIVSGSIMTYILSWVFTRKIDVEKIKISFAEYKEEVGSLLKLGMSFLVGGLILQGTNYFSRVLISRNYGVSSVGLYTAAYTLSIVYINFILTAMGTDFYPRLTAIADDSKEVNRLVNEQTIMGLLLSMTGVSILLAFPDLFLTLFYSKEFLPSSLLLQFLTVGMAVKIVTWPIGFIIVAKSKGRIFAFTESIWGILYIVLLYVATLYNNLAFIGLAFMATYILHALIILYYGRKLSGFSWNNNSIEVIIVFFASVIAIFILKNVTQGIMYYIPVILILIFSAVYSYKKMIRLLNINIVQLFKKKILKRK